MFDLTLHRLLRRSGRRLLLLRSSFTLVDRMNTGTSYFLARASSRSGVGNGWKEKAVAECLPDDRALAADPICHDPAFSAGARYAHPKPRQISVPDDRSGGTIL